MSGWARPRNLLIGGGVLAALAFVPTPGSKTTYANQDDSTIIPLQGGSRESNPKRSDADVIFRNPFVTQGTKNVADRFSAGGGTDVHTPGVATKRGTFPRTP